MTIFFEVYLTPCVCTSDPYPSAYTIETYEQFRAQFPAVRPIGDEGERAGGGRDGE